MGEGVLEVMVGAQQDVVPPGTILAEDVAAPPVPLATVTVPQRDGAVRPVAGRLLRVSVFGPPRVFWRPARPPAASTAAPVDHADTDTAAAQAAASATNAATNAVEQGGVIDADEQEVTAAFQPRTRELLVFLAIHPDGASRDTLAPALWPDSAPGRLGNTLHTAFRGYAARSAPPPTDTSTPWWQPRRAATASAPISSRSTTPALRRRRPIAAPPQHPKIVGRRCRR
jgi:hypothetical protein